MTRREVLVQLDDHLVENLDVLARELGLSRSELLRRGAQAILDADALKKADRRLQYSYQSLPRMKPSLKLPRASRERRHLSGEARRHYLV